MHSSRIRTIAAVLVGALSLSPAAVLAQDATPPAYEIGSIPALRVWYSSEARVDFVVMATSTGSDATFTATYDPNDGILGARSFDTNLHRFSYVPSPEDSKPFTVTFTAEKGTATSSQTVTITPLRPLPAETTVFGLQPKGPLPDGESTDFLDVSTTVISGSVWFNAQTRPSLRSIKIVGKTVVLQPDHPNGLWGYDNAADIRDLGIDAETLVIRGALALPGTNITIRATEVRFEDEEGQDPASINTTPLSSNVQPANYAEGRPGHNGGSLTLFADAVTGAGGIKRFILNGGIGERAGQGTAGTHGANRATIDHIDNGFLRFSWTDKNTIYAYWDSTFNTSAGDSTWPGDGGPAKAGGKPGIAGDGGDVLSNLDLSQWTTNQGGVQGTVADYRAGGAGGNPRPAWRRYYKGNSFDHYTEHYSSAGAGAYGPDSAKPSGASGAVTTLTGDLRWLSPLALQKVMMHIRQAYLAQHFDFVRETLADYIDLIGLASSLPEWANLDATDRTKLLQLLDEMKMLRHRVDSNLDYFGNPAGWVPMLSFEVNKLAFENEIPRALRVMYLNYWLRSRADNLQKKVDAMTQMRIQLRDQIKSDRDAYDTAVAAIPQLQYQAQQVQDEIGQVKTDIETIKNTLLQKAKDIALLKKTARAIGGIAEVVPVGQPYVGVAGNVLKRLPDIDPDKPVTDNAFIIGTGVAGDVASGSIGPDSAALKLQQDNLSDAEIEAAQAQQFEQIRALQAPVMDFLGETLSQMRATQQPSPEVEAELQRLLADEPGFKVLSKRLKELDRRKLEFATKLAQTVQEVSRLSLSITRNLLTIDILNRKIVDGSMVLDPETLGALDAMNERARDRLLRYHYFMARAYEYRMLQPYDGDLDLTKITDRFTTLGNATGPDLTSDEFDSLRAVYEDQISSVVFTILNNYNSNRPTLSAPVRLTLPQSILDDLNAGKSPTLNLTDLGIFLPDQENVRIVNLKVIDMQVAYTGSKDDIFYADLIFQHSGESRLQKDGETYLFRHYNEETRSKIEWTTRFDPYDGTLDPVQPAASDQSLLKALLSTGSSTPTTDDLLLYSRPSADADLLLSLQVNAFNGANLQLTRVRIELQYDFSRMSDQIKTLSIAPAADGPETRVAVTQQDLNGRTDGEGGFERAYNIGSTVTLSADERIGQYQFDHWEGAGIAAPTSSTTSVSMSDSRSVMPVYKLVMPRSLVVNGGTGTGTYVNGDVVAISAVVPSGQKFVRWDGATVASPTSANTTVTLNADTTVTAVYAALGGFSSLVNISNRAVVGKDSNILIAGFYIGGTAPKKVLARVVGETLGGDPYNVPGVLNDPKITIFSGQTVVAGNDNWEENPNPTEVAAAMQAAGAFPLASGSHDAALLITLPPGGYTVQAAGVNGATGVALLELYDADQSNTATEMKNISGRADVGDGSNILIAGFVVVGDQPQKVLVRAVGPTLAGDPFNLPGTLGDPLLTIYKGQAVIASNDDWSNEANAAEIASTGSTVGAFPIPSGSKDSALLLTLEPGLYTAQVSGVNGAKGVAIVEVYSVDN